MVYRSPPSWLPQTEFDEFNDITYDKIKSYTSIPKLKRLERYMREEGFPQTAEVARQRIIAQGGKDPLCPEPCLTSSEVEDVFQNIQFWQEDIKGKDAELQKLLNLKSTTILNGACGDLSDLKTCSPEVRKLSPQVMDLDSSSKEEKAKKLPKKDIRSGREYYQGWDKYVSHWEKENTIEEKRNKGAVAKELSKESFMDPVAQTKKRNESGVEAKPLIEREWLANREREKGNDLFKAEEFNSSLHAYTKAINMYKDNAVLYANRAAVYLKMNRNEEAYADCTEALKLDPQNVKAFMRRAKASLEMNEPSKALNDLNEALKFEPTNEEVLRLKRNAEDALKKHSTLMRTCQGSLPGGRRLAVEEVEVIATEINQLKNPLEKDEEKDPKIMADEWRVQGNTHFAEGELQKACDCYSKSLTHVSDNVTVLCNRSLCQLKLKNYIAAEMDASKALSLDSSFIKAFHHRGLARRALGMLELAIEDLKEVLRAIPGEKSVASELKVMTKELNGGRLPLPKREGPMIIEEIHEDIAQLPISKHNSSRLCPSVRDQELQEGTLAVSNTEEKMTYVHTQKSFIKNSSDHVQTPCQDQGLQQASVTIQKIHGDATQVQIQECFTTDNYSHMESISKDRDYSWTKFCPSDLRSRSSSALQTSNGECPEKQHEAVQKRMRGNEYFKSGQYVEAIGCYNESLELDPTVAATYINRALCHLRLKEPANAIDDCTQAILLDPQNSKAYYRRATSRQQIKDHIGALEDCKMFISLCPGDGSVKTLIKELESELRRQTTENEPKEPVGKPCDASNNLVEVKKLHTTKNVSEILQNPDKWRTASIPGTPKSALEFERSCLDLLKKPLSLKEYIQAIKTNLYPTIFKEDLTARFLKLVGVFLKENITWFESKEIFDILEGFTRVKRFQIVVMFLEPCGKEVLKELFEHLAAARVDVNCLRCKYLPG